MMGWMYIRTLGEFIYNMLRFEFDGPHERYVQSLNSIMHKYYHTENIVSEIPYWKNPKIN